MNHTVPTRVFKLSPITHGHVVRTLWVHPPTSALLPISQGLCLLQLLFPLLQQSLLLLPR